jgi:hypothetical protein
MLRQKYASLVLVLDVYRLWVADVVYFFMGMGSKYQEYISRIRILNNNWIMVEHYC